MERRGLGAPAPGVRNEPHAVRLRLRLHGSTHAPRTQAPPGAERADAHERSFGVKLLQTLGCVICFAACSPGDPQDSTPPTGECAADAGSIPSYSEVEAFTTCTMCHSSKLSATARMQAPANVNFDSYAAAKANAQDAVSLVREGSMPPASSKLKLTQAAKDELYRWGLCGTPQD
jgi:uncharacterized membrane protein